MFKSAWNEAKTSCFARMPLEHNSHIHKDRKLNGKEIYEYEEVILSIAKELKSVFSLISNDETWIAGKAT